jgi:hypothetical protein
VRRRQNRKGRRLRSATSLATIGRQLSQFDGRTYSNGVLETDDIDIAMPRITRGVSGLLSLAAWFGLAAGVVEAVISIGLRHVGVPIRVSAEILWIAPVVDLGLFLIIGAALTLVVRALPTSMRSHVVFLTFLWVLAYIVLEIFDVMRPWAVLVLSLGIAVEGSRRLSASDRGVQAMERTFVHSSLSPPFSF